MNGCLITTTAVVMFKLMVLPLLKYGACFLLNYTSIEKTKIQRIQNKGLKLVYNRIRHYDTNMLQKEALWEGLVLIYVFM